jgi:carboxypeptidase C (cathepsin A)
MRPGGLRSFKSLMQLHRIIVFSIALLTAAAPALAQSGRGAEQRHQQQQQSKDQQPSGPGVLRLLPADSVTEHVLDTPQGKLNYTATAGTTPLYGQSGEQIAAMFYTSYVAKNAGGKRPLTFAFNGGPGAASAFLNLGVVGPRRLDFGPDAHHASEAKLVDNPDSWLRFTDLVLVDPIGTGWSRTAKADEAKDFWKIQSDADSFAKFISNYAAKHDRTLGPIYLMGESYGGFRAAKVARALQRDYGFVVSGIVMLSPLLEGWLTFGDDQSALRSALLLPSLAAARLVAQNKLSADALGKAEKFALTDYLTALAGPPLSGEAAQAFYNRVADITGVPADSIAKSRGFVTGDVLKVLRDGKLVSRYDADFAIDDPFPERRASRAPDPILDGVARAYGGAFANYARNELGFNTEITYKLLANDVTSGWDWGHAGRGQVGAEDELRVLLSFDPHFRLLIAHGMTDLVTPYADTRYLLEHLPNEDPPGRAQLKLYRGGHMFYLYSGPREAFSKDAAAFYKAAP